ncbi:hypothetical protein CDV31_001703 [Fusarium ambrosium]|uniref:C3H1-type domain-containing protein n=1 Tax=Fusarium ambrosium TaxID=131363 RepID=A0A428UZ24_9HYPO|nr:hypothetical protein CDV31_001703 [Fusarium ambrosium]
MADPDPSPELKGPTVAASANQCLESFQQCLFSASAVHPREVSMVEDQLARFSSWATSIGVFAPGSASMDHRLRYASEVQSVVTGLLESLNYRVQTCSKALAQLGQSSSTDASTTANDRLAQSFLDIAAEISRLNKISNTIRRASKDTQVLKASNFQIKDDDGENVETLLLEHFEHHINDWFPGIHEKIRQRLARAMLLRRKRILYRRHRQGNTSIRSDNTISQTSVTLPDAQAGAASQVQAKSRQHGGKSAIEKSATKVAPSQVKSATTLAPEKFKMVSSTPSIVSATRTIASGKHQVLTYPPAPGFAAKRRYEKLKKQRIIEAAGSSTESSLKELLEADLQAIGEITCPYCLYALPAAEVFDDRKWQNHVKNDLDPYVCLFEKCDQADVLYTHSDEWLGHLHQHGKVWRCSSHREMGPFSTLEDYMQHMREVHDTKLSDRQLRVVANRNSRKATKLFPSCPLCGREESEVDGRLEDHLAGHLRSLALKSLPSYQDEIPDDVADENNSIDGSRPRSRSTLREMEEEKEMLQEGAESFWDQWTPELTQGISVNFLGDVHFELDLGDNEAQVASLFFDTMVFKKSTEDIYDDPILQSLLQQQLAAVIDVGTDVILNLSVEQEAASSSQVPVGEPSGQDEVDSTLTQQPIDVDEAHVQGATTGQDTKVDIPKGGDIPETPVEPMTQVPPPTKSDIPSGAESASLSNVPTDKTSGQDKVDDTLIQQHVDSEAGDSQTVAPGKGTEIDSQGGDEAPEILVEPTTEAPPPTKLDIPVDAESVSLSNLPKVETSGQVDVDDPTTQESTNAETIHAQNATVEQDVKDLFPERIKGPEPTRPETEPDPLAVTEEADLFDDTKNGAYRQLEAMLDRELTQLLSNARFRDRVTTAALQRSKYVENPMVSLPLLHSSSFKRSRLTVAKTGYRERPDVREFLTKILLTREREETSIRDVEAQIRALANSLFEDLNPALLESASDGEQDAQLKTQDAQQDDVQPKTQDILCREVLIYGHCRYEDQGCVFNHDPNRNAGPPLPPSSQLGREPGAAAPGTTTRTYAVTQDPRSHRPITEDATRSRRLSTLDSTSRPPVIVMTTEKVRPSDTTSQSSNARSGSPIRDEYRFSEGQFYTQPSSPIGSRGTTHSYADQAGPYSTYGGAPSGEPPATPSLKPIYTDSPQLQPMGASTVSSGVAVEAARDERDNYRQTPYQPTSQSGTNSPQSGHRSPPIPEFITTRPPGASVTGSASLEKDDSPDGKKRPSSIYINGEKAMDLDFQSYPITKVPISSSSFGKASGGNPYSKQPTRPATTFDSQPYAVSGTQAWDTGVPRDGNAHQHDLGSPSVPMTTQQPANDNYYPYPPVERDPLEPLPYIPSYHPNDAFEADVEDDITRPKISRRKKTRPRIYINGETVGDLSRESSLVGSRRERIVIVDNQKDQEAWEKEAREREAAEAVERYKQAELERIAKEKAHKEAKKKEYEKRLREDLAKSGLDAEAIDAIMKKEEAKREEMEARREEREAREREAAEAVERYKQSELERISKEKADNEVKDNEAEQRLREDHKGERIRSRSPSQISTTSRTTSNAMPYDTIGPRPIIVEERPRVEIEIVDSSRSRRPRHASHDPRSTPRKKISTRPRHASYDPGSVYILDDDDEEERRQRRLERRRQREEDARQEEEDARQREEKARQRGEEELQKEEEDRLRRRLARKRWREKEEERQREEKELRKEEEERQRKEDGRQRGEEELLKEEEERLGVRIAEANAEINHQEPSPYRRPAVEVLDPEVKKEEKEKGSSVVDFDSEAELAEAIRRLKAEQERYEKEARRPSQKEEGKGKEKEGEENQFSIEDPDCQAEIMEALRRLRFEEERREERARRRAQKEDAEEDEIQRMRLRERMQPKRPDAPGPSSRRNRILYDDGVYRYE